ncbi:MAG TPA: hypothetical protein VES89_12575, partial [Candidatus Competibacteraceae bacterium]|nr:hypothetical protein [Candidatus Competibacteraceae bacterium]
GEATHPSAGIRAVVPVVAVRLCQSLIDPLSVSQTGQPSGSQSLNTLSRTAVPCSTGTRI